MATSNTHRLKLGKFNTDLAGLVRVAKDSPFALFKELPLVNLNCCDSMYPVSNTDDV